MSLLFVILMTALIAVNGQRSPYAGSRPGSGYKDRFTPQSGGSSSAAPASSDNSNIDSSAPVGDRLGENSPTTSSTSSSSGSTTQRLPYDAYGDKFIVDHWNSLPVDQRPFWIVNQQHIENQRGTPAGTSSTQSTISTQGAAINNNGNIVDRFGENTNRPVNQRPVNNVQNTLYNPNIISQQEVVYPDNLTAEQRLEMEINVQRQRLEALERQRQQLASQNGQQTGQTQQMQQQFQNARRVQREFVPSNDQPHNFRRSNALVAPYFTEFDY